MALFFTAFMVVTLSFPSSVAFGEDLPANQTPNTLYDNLRAPGAKWSVAQEYVFIDKVADRYRASKDGEYCTSFQTPNGQLYYFGVAETSRMKQPIFIVNHRVFPTLEKFKHYIHDRSDFELIGASLGVYNGPITVSLPSHEK